MGTVFRNHNMIQELVQRKDELSELNDFVSSRKRERNVQATFSASGHQVSRKFEYVLKIPNFAQNTD